MNNRTWRLQSRPVGKVTLDNLRWSEEPIGELGEGDVVVRNKYLSIDPTHRIWMSDMDQYMPPIAIGEVIRSGGIGIVETSRSSDFTKGDLVFGLLGWQDYAVVPAAHLRPLPREVPMSPTAFLSVLGLTGVTAYFGLLDIASPKAGETLVVSGAAGAVGSIVGQIGKIKGMRVIGIAGSDDKCEWLTGQLGFDGAVNYRRGDVGREVQTLCPHGVDVYFDNVGGTVSDAVWSQMNLFGRISVCGLISGYNDSAPMPGPKHYSRILMKRLTVRGFIVTDYAARWNEAVMGLLTWVNEGRIHYAEEIVVGLDQAPIALNKLFDGSNTGKLIVEV